MPTMTLPSWAPSLIRVATYVPGRTLVAAADGYGDAHNTFDSTTHPTDTAVNQLITDACAWVTVKTGTIDATLNDMAAATAAVYVAAAVERGYPDSSKDTSIAAELWTQAVSMRDDLAHANDALTGQVPDVPTSHLVPQGSFPVAVPWGDYDFF